MVLPVIFLSMAVLLTVFFVCLSAISENSKIHIGVVVPEKGFMERGLLEYVSNMADTKALCVFRELSETEAKEQLDEGKVAAYVTLPENLLEKIYRNEKTSVHITTAKTPTIESALMEELVDSAVSFVLTAKAGDYAAYQLYAKYGRQGSMKTVAMDMNRNYIRFVLRQETLFHEKTIKSASGMNDTTRIFLGMFLCMTAGFYGFAALLGVKVTMLNTCGIVFGSFCAACLLACVVPYGRANAGQILFLFVFAVVQFVLLGGAFPDYMLPKILVSIGKILPGGVFVDLLHAEMKGQIFSSSLIYILMYGVCFFCLALWRMKRKRGGIA